MDKEGLYISISEHSIIVSERNNDGHTLSKNKIKTVGYNQPVAGILIESLVDFKANYKQVFCALKQSFFVLVPDVLFSEDSAPEFLEGIDLKEKRVLFDRISRNGVVCVYAVECDLYEKLILRFPNCIIRHFASVMIDHTLQTGFASQSIIAALDFEAEEFYLTLVNKSELLMSNRFSFNSPEDVLYFLLYSIEQFALSPNQCKVVIEGFAEKNTESVMLLNEYFEQVAPNEIYSNVEPEFSHQSNFFHQNACA